MNRKARAEDSVMQVAITFVYRKGRSRYLHTVLRTLSWFPVRSMQVDLMCDMAQRAEVEKFIRLVSYLQRSNFRVRAKYHKQDDEHLFWLTWKHKVLILEEFLPQIEFTHFVYLEDDIEFSFENFSYFVEYRETFAGHGQIPSFLRVEYSHSKEEIVLSDQYTSTSFPENSHESEESRMIISPLFPYCAMYILDRQLATQHIRSKAADKLLSATMLNWGLAERAAIGSCWVDIPSGLRHRFAVIVDAKTLIPAPECLVWHLPNTFADKNLPSGAAASLSLQDFIVDDRGR